MTDVRGECFEHPDRKKTASQIASCYNQSTKNSISERTTDGLQQQIATPSEKKGACPGSELGMNMKAGD